MVPVKLNGTPNVIRRCWCS